MMSRNLILVLVVCLALGGFFYNYQDSSIFTGSAVKETVSVSFSGSQGIGNTEPTPNGTDVEVDFPNQDANVTFNEVTVPGTTTVTKTQGNPKGTIPSGFKSVGLFWEITTTATYVPPITICITGFDVKPGHKIFHWENVPPERWIDRTSFRDVVNDILCAEVNSLSPFGVFGPADAAASTEGDWSGGGGSGYDPRYASANTVYDAQKEPGVITKEPEERPKVEIKEKIKEIIDEFKEPAEEVEVEPEAVLEPKPVKAAKETAPIALLISLAFALIIIGLVIVFFKVEK